MVEIKYNVTFICLHRKDPSAFFSFPVTDFIAPGYSMIIKHPMDFSTMKEKIKNNDYQSIEELKVIVISNFILLYEMIGSCLAQPGLELLSLLPPPVRTRVNEPPGLAC